MRGDGPVFGETRLICVLAGLELGSAPVRFGHISVSVGFGPCSYTLDWVAVWSGQVRLCL
jgi:hypothetical protein